MNDAGNYLFKDSIEMATMAEKEVPHTNAPPGNAFRRLRLGLTLLRQHLSKHKFKSRVTSTIILRMFFSRF